MGPGKGGRWQGKLFIKWVQGEVYKIRCSNLCVLGRSFFHCGWLHYNAGSTERGTLRGCVFYAIF